MAEGWDLHSVHLRDPLALTVGGVALPTQLDLDRPSLLRAPHAHISHEDAFLCLL